MKVNHRPNTFTGFKITRRGSEADVEWDGEKFGEGEYTLTDKRFSTTQTLTNGKSLTTTISLGNNLPSLLHLCSWGERSYLKIELETDNLLLFKAKRAL